jgi:hypothetical protein
MIPRPISLTFVSVAAQFGLALQPALVPGALSVDCRSALWIGVVTCGGGTTDTDQATRVSEAQVTEFLAQYGKPPREAVRALLDPTDSNITAWIRKQREIVAIASYVAARMTAISSRPGSGGFASVSSPTSAVPSMVQMRVTLFFKFGNPSSVDAVHALQTVVDRYPSIDGRLVQVGPAPDPHLRKWLTTLNAVLPISIAAPEEIGNISVPSLLIEDLRYGTRQRLDATDITIDRICNQIVAVRATAEMSDRTRGPIQLAP